MLKFRLPLPPSKNKRKVLIRTRRKYPIEVTSSSCKKFRREVAFIVKGKLEHKDLEFLNSIQRDEMIELRCYWFLECLRSDVSNFHDELCDALSQALGVNDKHFLIKDCGLIKAPYVNQGVFVIIPQKKIKVQMFEEVKDDRRFIEYTREDAEGTQRD